jgi:type IV fimbrial biogenesis protein FimT
MCEWQRGQVSGSGAYHYKPKEGVMKKNGYSLLELLITLLVFAILLSVALPSFTRQIQLNRILTETDNLQQSIVLARSRAVGLNQRVTMSHHGNWAEGWDIFIDSNHNGRRDEDEEIIWSHTRPLQVSIRTTSPVENYVSFTGTGQSHRASGRAGGAFQAGTFILCLEDVASTELIISRGGRVRLVKGSSETC